MPLGSQDLWVAGSRFFYKRDPFDAAGNGVLVAQPWVDLGIIETANPTLTPTTSTLKDGVSGIRQLVDSRTIRQLESYAIQTRNLSLRNWNLLLRGRRVESFGQTAGTNITRTCTHRFHPGQLVKIQDEVGKDLYALLNVHGVYTTTGITTGVVTAISAGTPGVGPYTITVTGSLIDPAAPVGSFVVLKPEGLAGATAQANAGTYEILSKVTTGPTVLTVREVISSTEGPSLVGSIVYKSGAGGNVSQGPRNTTPAWKVRSLSDGTIYAVEGGAISTEVDLVIAFSVGSVANEPRLVLPQTQVGEVTGKMELFWPRGNYAEISVRRSRVAIIPASAEIVVEGDQFSSMTFTVDTLTDETSLSPDGDLLYFKGALPAFT